MSTALAPLWAIEADLTALLDAVDTCPDDLQPELQQKIAEYMSREAAKVDQVAHVLAALEYEQKCAGDEIARLQERKKAAAKAQEKLEQYVCRVIQAAGGKKLAGKTNTLSVRPSDAVVITDEAAVPRGFVSEKVSMPYIFWESLLNALKVSNFGLFAELSDAPFDCSIDKAAIKKALKAGEEIPGADLEFRANLQRR